MRTQFRRNMTDVNMFQEHLIDVWESHQLIYLQLSLDWTLLNLV